MKVIDREDRGSDFEEVIKIISSFPHSKKELVVEYIDEILVGEELLKKPITRKEVSTASSLEQLATRYPNVNFAGFISRDSDKEQYQLWKLNDAFEEVAEQMGRKNFEKLKITLIVSGHRITYISNGTIAVNYERFSKEDLVVQLIAMAHQQGP